MDAVDGKGLPPLAATAHVSAKAGTIDATQGTSVLVEERSNRTERDLVHTVVQIDVAGALDDHELLRLRGGREGGFAEIAV